MSASFISNAVEQIYGQISGKQKANEWYKLLVPELHEALERGTPMSDPQLKKLVEAITNLAPVGAKRNNFKRRYMEDRESMLSLPRDPNSIMYGYWW
ncbi:hypothetical protein ABMY36_22245 [Vibrio vulnificus]|uniref:hypothetical protein n=1 Tax=Vibrio vulnificus TaxID=672 RepID=UPI00405853D1